MAMTIRGFDTGAALRICVHLDETKVLEDGVTPDPNWCLFFEWGRTPPEGRTMEAYLADIKRDALGLGEEELRRRMPPVEVDLSL